ncbi:endoglucanase [Arthrobacter sp. CAN_A214]|uniref:cellulase family glycosylhydrolase n=1 Tax=Arthrobacter sp. CAN_A214 TaxID=2787720 RepID=UPI001A20BAC9
MPSTKMLGLLKATLCAVVVLLVLSGLAVAKTGTGEVRAAETTAANSGWLHTDGGTIRDAANNPYVIKSTSWFGLETPECAPHGLWTINLAEGIRQIKDMGFNTIRLPYSNECITTGETSSIDYSANPDLLGKAPLEVMDAVIAVAKANGLNVILDRHRPDSGSQSELWYTPTYSEETWIADWARLADRYKNNPTVIGVDLHNEPRGAACWGCGNPATDWQAAATRAGNTVLSINPNLLIIVEGIENESDGTATWWGSGLKGVATHPIGLDVDHRVVYSPHDYPGSVYPQKWFSAPDYPVNLPGVWDTNWGYIARQGIAPVLLGEFGTKLETTSDKQWLDQMVKYLDSTGISYSYWSYNPNSGDTGGLIKDNWRTPETSKLTALAFLLQEPSVTQPTKQVTTDSTTPPSPTTPPRTAQTANSMQWVPEASWETGYVASIKVTADEDLERWSVKWDDPNATAVANAWGMTCTAVPKESITCVGADWASTLNQGQTVTVGLQVDSSNMPTDPPLTTTVD